MKIDFLAREKGLMCPICSNKEFDCDGSIEDGLITCKKCGHEYLVKDKVPSLIDIKSDNYKSKKEITDFWQHLYHAAYDGHEVYENKKLLQEKLVELEKLFKHRQHLAVTEMPIESISKLKVLEIGSGAGAHSSLFCMKGGDVTALDITLDRAHATSKKLNVLDESKNSFAIHADAEKLPFDDDYFDIVYSNGVLHHTHDTQRAVNEVYRVLKPKGKAVIMLYAKHSFLYWVNLFLIRGILLGGIFKSKKWLGKSTEWMSKDKQEIYNPETKVYSHNELKLLFKKFERIQLRKVGFIFDQMPLLGKIISKACGIFTGYNESGNLIYDKAWRNETKLELFLSKFIGFANNISAYKD